MHIMPDAIDSAFAVHRDPQTQEPMKFSVQFFDREGKPALKLFLTQDKRDREPVSKRLIIQKLALKLFLTQDEDAKGYREADLAAFDRIKKMYRKGESA